MTGTITGTITEGRTEIRTGSRTEVTTDAALERLLDEGRRRAGAIDPHHALLWESLGRAADGGKRFRPALLVATHDALGGDASGPAAEVGAAIELLHTAFVIHDDVIDDDHVRRGRPNVSGTFGALARVDGAGASASAGYGLTAAVLAGDLAIAAAVRAVATCGAAPEVVARLLDLFDVALHATAAGELADVRLALGVADASLAQSLEMESLKTGAYSFSLPLQAGAVLAGADTATVERLGHAGRAMGVAFQLADDLIGVFGDPRHSGKSVTCDLRTGKQTPLIVHARSTAQWGRISTFLGRDLRAEELDEVRALLEESGSRDFVEDLADRYLEEARSVLRTAGLPVEILDRVTTRPLAVGDGEAAA